MPFASWRKPRAEAAPSKQETGIPPDAGDLLAVSLNYWEAGSDRILVLSRETGRTLLLDHSEASVLQALRRPCGPQELADRLMSMGWERTGLSQLPTILGTLSERGLVRRLGEILADVKKSGGSGEPGLSCLAWPTRDRPETMRRALEAWSNALKESGQALDLVIADDSTRAADATRSTVSQFASSYPGRVLLLDRAFRNRLAGELRKIDERAAAFPLGLAAGNLAPLGTYGAVRNLILLAAAGRTVAMSDDDTVPDFRRHPESVPGLALCADFDPAIVRPFADRAGLEAFAAPAGTAPLEPHRRMLGRLCGDLALEAPPLDAAHAEADTIAALLGPENRVAALCFGSWGDAGMGAARYMLATRGEIEGDMDDKSAYEAAMSGGLIFRAPLRATIGGGSFLGMHMALDARSVLPPFSPSGRNEDGLWGACLSLLHPQLAIAYPTQAILHDPLEPRRRNREDAVRWRLGLNEVLRLAIGILSDRFDPGAQAYAELGARLIRLASGPASKLRNTLADAAAQVAAGRLGLLERTFAEFGGEPAWWAADMKAAMDNLTNELENGAFWMPSELDGDEAALASYLREFGRLLEAWPAIFDAAVHLGPELLESARLAPA